MSKLGFGRAAQRMAAKKYEFFRGAILLAKNEWSSNFDMEKDAESGTDWDMVLRGVPPPILRVTGRLQGETTKSGRLRILRDSLTYTINPTDERGRSYAAYHQEGTQQMPKRVFLTQSSSLSKRQQKLLDRIFYRIF